MSADGSFITLAHDHQHKITQGSLYLKKVWFSFWQTLSDTDIGQLFSGIKVFVIVCVFRSGQDFWVYICRSKNRNYVYWWTTPQNLRTSRALGMQEAHERDRLVLNEIYKNTEDKIYLLTWSHRALLKLWKLLIILVFLCGITKYHRLGA